MIVVMRQVMVGSLILATGAWGAGRSPVDMRAANGGFSGKSRAIHESLAILPEQNSTDMSSSYKTCRIYVRIHLVLF
jgi:hypothetical protein